ncbi:MAG: hypothetical protein H0V17_23345 [Deltaproteobacteria bacterium]|nr:hypothetical protein [Deltaproteobacteria bacterium]
MRFKLDAHDRWVCIACRWSAKFPLIDDTEKDKPSYACPTCRKRMKWTGTAFRPPRRDDDEAWQVVERILAAGFRYRSTQNRRRFPRKLRELKAWFEEQDRPVEWLPERVLSVAKTADGHHVVRAGRRVLHEGEDVLVHHDGRWRAAQVRLSTCGTPLYAAILLLARKVLPITVRTRLLISKRRP